jgi:hypothetical protein
VEDDAHTARPKALDHGAGGRQAAAGLVVYLMTDNRDSSYLTSANSHQAAADLGSHSPEEGPQTEQIEPPVVGLKRCCRVIVLPVAALAPDTHTR